jgi:hypothetical protein
LSVGSQEATNHSNVGDLFTASSAPHPPEMAGIYFK